MFSASSSAREVLAAKSDGKSIKFHTARSPQRIYSFFHIKDKQFLSLPNNTHHIMIPNAQASLSVVPFSLCNRIFFLPFTLWRMLFTRAGSKNEVEQAEVG